MSDTVVNVIANPATGEVIDLDNADSVELAQALAELAFLLTDVDLFRHSLVDELARRLDRENRRSAELGPFKVETNPPTEEVYTPDSVRRELGPLVEEGLLAPEVLHRLITLPTPRPPSPRVDKREVGKLKRSDDRRILAALARARDVRPQSRTITVKRLEEKTR